MSISTYVSSRGSSEGGLWSSEKPSASWSKPSGSGGGLGAVARHNPQWRRIFSITSPCGGSMKS
ncbi:MAG: hypothetical protein U9N87_09965, partial [Planctomycetota bacterium]|nr:hypothetical protein [Planctomycetota bacterium]